MSTSPNTDNLSIPTGIVWIKIDDVDSDYRDMGEVKDFTVSQSIETKEYVSVRQGIGKTALKVTTKVASTCKWTANEITPENLAIFVGGDLDTDTAGNTTIQGLTSTKKTGAIRVVGTNDNGPQLQFDAAISITPSGDISLLAQENDFMDIPLEADIIVGADGEFGTWTFLTQGT
jgi:hypothetical protein